jgi:hypothetical protein
VISLKATLSFSLLENAEEQNNVSIFEQIFFPGKKGTQHIKPPYLYHKKLLQNFSFKKNYSKTRRPLFVAAFEVYCRLDFV